MIVNSIGALLLSGRMIVAFMMGFSCGLPLMLTGSLLQAWMTDAGIRLETIGMAALIGLPYTIKFLWAPLLDRYIPPFLGRRRGWLLPVQTLLLVLIASMGLVNPMDHLLTLMVIAILVAFFSATQDIAVDAYRRESLSDSELGLGSSLYVYGYRIGMLLSSGGGLILADYYSYPTVYWLMALGMLIGLLTTWWAVEPPVTGALPSTLKEAIWSPFIEYFQRPGAWEILAFILLYKIGDTLASSLTTPFYMDLGFSKSMIGSVVKIFGFWATMAGIFFGGIVVLKRGFAFSLWFFGWLQAISTVGFALLAWVGPSLPALATVISIENLTGGMGTAAFVGYMGSLTNKRFTATQYALLSSLMGIPRVLASAPTGYLVTWMGWPLFFIGCCLIALPGLFLIQTIFRHPPILSDNDVK